MHSGLAFHGYLAKMQINVKYPYAGHSTHTLKMYSNRNTASTITCQLTKLQCSYLNSSFAAMQHDQHAALLSSVPCACLVHI